jgi:hypothetical protein
MLVLSSFQFDPTWTFGDIRFRAAIKEMKTSPLCNKTVVPMLLLPVYYLTPVRM